MARQLAWHGRDESGAVKGDGLVTYLKAPSVDLAIQIIDGTPLRDGVQQLLSVSQARMFFIHEPTCQHLR